MRGKRNHKGRSRQFTAPTEIDRQLNAHSQCDYDNLDSNASSTSNFNNAQNDQDSDDSLSSERHKGVSHLIKVCNPNHQNSGTETASRKEIEASARTAMNPINLKSNDELARDIARLELVRKERQEATAKLEKEKAMRREQQMLAAQRIEAKVQSNKQKGKHKSNKNIGMATKSSINPQVNNSANVI